MNPTTVLTKTLITKSEIKCFYNLVAWKKGHELCLLIYELTKAFPNTEAYGIVSQLRRAASSITANIAEGFARYHYKDKVRFYYQSRGSAAEVQNFLLLARDLGYISVSSCLNLFNKTAEVSRLINGMIKSIESQHA